MLPIATGPSLRAAYGGTQAGVLARFDLGTSDRLPQAYVRAVYAPDRPRQADVAAGLGARPIASIPVRLQAEVRATRAQRATFVRPVVLAVSELAPVALPLDLQAEAYAQAGWAGGRYSTGFVDGQVRIDRPIVAAGPAKVRLGVGAWGGAQKSASRLDVGPSVTLDLRESAVPARISVDYRYRVAGNARPGNGLAITLSTGF